MLIWIKGKLISPLLFLLIICQHSYATNYYTYTNGSSAGTWSDPNIWTTDPTGSSLTGNAVPGNNDQVYILNGFTVSLTQDISTTGLSINIYNGGTLNLDVYQFTNTITTLSGSGLLQLKSGNFPAVTNNTFAANSIATVEYKDFSGTLNLVTAYPNLTFTNNSASNHTITIPSLSSYSLAINGGLLLQRTDAGSLAVTIGNGSSSININLAGNATIGTGTTLNTGSFGSTHAFNISGNFINNGTVQFSNNAQYTRSSGGSGVVNLNFIGSASRTLSCNNITNLNALTVDKGSGSTYTLSVVSTDVSNLNFYTSGSLLNINNGTLRLGSNINLDRMFGGSSSNYDVGSTTSFSKLWIDGATVNANKSALVVYGIFQITAGSFTSTGGQGAVIREEGKYLIYGGTVTVEKFRPSTTAATHRGSFIMTGGTFIANGTNNSNDGYARFSIPYPEQVFEMTGGSINVYNPVTSGTGIYGGIHLGIKSGNYTVTGGTFNAFLSGTAQYFDILSSVPLYNLNISRQTGSSNTTLRLNGIGNLSGATNNAQPLVVLNDLTIDGTNALTFNPTTLEVTVGRHFTLGTGATYDGSANITLFNGSGNQTFTNNHSSAVSLKQLTMEKSSGTLTLAGTASTFSVTNQLNLKQGILNDGGKLLNVSGNIYNAATHASQAGGAIVLNGTSTQTLSGNGNGIFANLTLNNVSNPGALTTCNQTISGILTLAGTGNSIFDIDIYQLKITATSVNVITTTGNGFSASKMIRTSGRQSDSGVRKKYGTLEAFTFPVGTAGYYTPATIQLTTAPAAYGDITVKPVNNRHPFVEEGNVNNLTFYWKVLSSGFSGLTAGSITQTFKYVDASVSPAGQDAGYVPARYNASAWTVINDNTQVDESSDIISFNSVDYIDGEFTAGYPSAFGIITTYYSKRNGNWTDTTPGSTPWSTVSFTGPDATTYPVSGDEVYIGNGTTYNHTITISANNQAAGSLNINSGSIVDVTTTTGHNFGVLPNSQVTGNGTLRISSASATAEFPAGDFGNFIRENGGTVEYYTTGSVDYTIPTISASPTALPLITYKNLRITPAAGHAIIFPNQNERIYGDVVIGGDPTGWAKLNNLGARTVTINGNLNIETGGLQFQNNVAQTVVIDQNINISANGTLNVASAGTAVTNLLSVNGNIINNGILDMVGGSNFCNTTFIGASNTSITGTGATTNFNVLTVNKGTSQNAVLEVNATNFSLSSTSLPLVLSNGTFRLTSAQTINIANGSSFTIPTTARLSANGGTLQLNGNSTDGKNLLLVGTLEVLSGTVNIGITANDNAIEYASSEQGVISISGGNLNVRGQIRRSTSSSEGALIYNQAGGTVTVGISKVANTSRGVFEMLNTGSSFTMSGGNLVIARSKGTSGVQDLYVQPSSYNVTGGTIQIGNSVGSQSIYVNTSVPFYDLSAAGSNNTAILQTNPLTLKGSLSIAAGCVFNANSLNVTVAGNFTNNNTDNTTGVTVGGFRAGSTGQITTLNGSLANQLISGVAGNLTNFGNLILNNTKSGGTVTLSANANLRVNGYLRLNSNTFDDGGNTVTVLSTVYNYATHISSGSGKIVLQGSGIQSIIGNGSGKFGNLDLNNASGASFSANQEITGTLTFTNGALRINAYRLLLSNTSLNAIVGSNSSRYIITSGQLSDEGVTKAFTGSLTSATFRFPVGVSGKFTPADYTISTGATGGTITLTPVNAKHPSATGVGNAYIKYYWKVTNNITNLTALTHTYTYVAADEAGASSLYRDARYNSNNWTIGSTAGNPNTTSRQITFSNLNLTGDYTAGELTAFTNPTVYTSIASGNWESDLSVWDTDPPGSNQGPPAGAIVVIAEGHTVTVTTGSKNTTSLEIRGRLHLGTTTGHNLGTVTVAGSGEKTIQLQGSSFPTGNFSSFVATGGGTVDYNGALTLPTQATYNNIVFTGSGVKNLANIDYIINGNFTINAGEVRNTNFSRNINLVNTTSGFTNYGIFYAGDGEVQIGRNLINSGTGVAFYAGNAGGIDVNGRIDNSDNAVFTLAAASLDLQGALNNNATFNVSSGNIQVGGNLNNSSTGSFAAGSGLVTINGDLNNSGSFEANNAVIEIANHFTNTGIGNFQADNSQITVIGNITNDASQPFLGSTSTILLQGNWDYSGGTFTPGSSTINFTGSTIQTLTGNTSFYNIINSGGGILSLQNDVTVTNYLTLSNGSILTNNYLLQLTNTSGQPVSGYGSGNYIEGKLQISFPNTSGTSRVFPVAKDDIYRPVTIYQNAVSTSPVISVEMINSAPSGSIASTLSSISDVRYYAIDLVSGTINSPMVDLSFNTSDPEDEAVSVPGNLRIAKSAAATGPWTDEGGSGVFYTQPAGHAISDMTTLSGSHFFALASTEDSPLPIEFLEVNARVVNERGKINWSTSWELNNDFFTIEKSTDQVNFEVIGTVEGAGTSTATQQYQFTDHELTSGNTYYRIKQTDFDGKFDYSKIVMVNYSTFEPAFIYTIYPNPSNTTDKVWIRMNRPVNTEVDLLVTNLLGHTVYSTRLHQVDENQISLERELSSGIYMVTITTNAKIISQRLVIK